MKTCKNPIKLVRERRPNRRWFPIVLLSLLASPGIVHESPSAVAGEAKEPKVLIIEIDGTRPDCLI